MLKPMEQRGVSSGKRGKGELLCSLGFAHDWNRKSEEKKSLKEPCSIHLGFRKAL